MTDLMEAALVRIAQAVCERKRLPLGPSRRRSVLPSLSQIMDHCREQASKAAVAPLDFEDDNRRAQRAAVEAAEVGRATLAQAQQQGEQLCHADRMADDAQYALDKAGRVLRGMTWSGWVANLFSSDVKRPGGSASGDGRRRREPPLVYEGLPDSCRAAAQAVQNYQANLNVLRACETDEQRETCRLICQNMHDAAVKQLKLLESNPNVQAYQHELEADLKFLRDQQTRSSAAASLTGSTAPPTAPLPNPSQTVTSPQRQMINPPSATSLDTSSAATVHEQDRHLQVLSQNLDELGSIAASLRDAVNFQNSAIDRLADKSDAIAEQGQRVTRRADRLVHHRLGSSWLPFASAAASRPQLQCRRVVLRHSDTGLYLAVVKGDVYLVPRCSTEACALSLYQRPQTQLVGLKHAATEKWLGQSAILGGIVCSAVSMGHREEWQIDGMEADEGWSHATLLCASAGWGSGGYVLVRQRDRAVILGGSTVEDRAKAARWTIVKDDDDNGA